MECKNFPNCDTDFSKRIAALEAELAEAKRVTFDPAVLEDMNRLEAENAELRKDAERLRGLEKLLGYVEDGSSDVVRIVQDDATKDWILSIGTATSRRYYARSFRSVIDAAMKETQS